MCYIPWSLGQSHARDVGMEACGWATQWISDNAWSLEGQRFRVWTCEASWLLRQRSRWQVQVQRTYLKLRDTNGGGLTRCRLGGKLFTRGLSWIKNTMSPQSPTRTTYIYAPPVDLRAVCLVRAICVNQIFTETLVILKRLMVVVVVVRDVVGVPTDVCLLNVKRVSYRMIFHKLNRVYHVIISTRSGIMWSGRPEPH